MFEGTITEQTRRDAEEKVDKQIRYQQITGMLHKWGDMTAKEIAYLMWRQGMIPTFERNFTSPRLTELKDAGLVEVRGKRKCKWTGRTVAVFGLTGDFYEAE